MTSLLHERDVTHYMTLKGSFWHLGDGAYADVHLGRHVRTGECVVIKRFTDSSLHTIEREIRTHSYIEQFLPNTPRLLGVLPAGDSLYNLSLVYQLVPGSNTFDDWLNVPEALSPIQWLSVALQLAENIDILHRKCILHNDLHSDNILLHFNDDGRYAPDCGMSMLGGADEDDVVKTARVLAKVKGASLVLPRVTIIDFGHATFREGKVYDSNTGSLGSCYHLAPETARHDMTTPAADVFSLGHEIEHVAKVLNSSALWHIVSLCTDPDPRARPPVRWVVHNLRKLFLLHLRQSVPDKPDDIFLQARSKLPNDYNDQSHPRAGKHYTEDLSSFFFDSFILSSRDSLLLPSDQRRTFPLNSCLGCAEPRTEKTESLHSQCSPAVMEEASWKLQLPYITHTGDLQFRRFTGKYDKILFESKYTSIYIGYFRSTGQNVAIKRLRKHGDYSRARHEAMMNLYLNDTGWVPQFYGVVPTSTHDVESLGIVQDFFAKGVTLSDVLKTKRPFGVIPRVRLALQLTSLMYDVHTRHMLINNFSPSNILCDCLHDSHCLDIKLIDLGAAGAAKAKYSTEI